jgi:chromosome segregation ATPase
MNTPTPVPIGQIAEASDAFNAAAASMKELGVVLGLIFVLALIAATVLAYVLTHRRSRVDETVSVLAEMVKEAREDKDRAEHLREEEKARAEAARLEESQRHTDNMTHIFETLNRLADISDDVRKTLRLQIDQNMNEMAEIDSVKARVDTMLLEGSAAAKALVEPLHTVKAAVEEIQRQLAALVNEHNGTRTDINTLKTLLETQLKAFNNTLSLLLEETGEHAAVSAEEGAT